MSEFGALVSDIRACSKCSEELPHEARPVIQIHQQAKILIAGQAPGRKVHASGVPFDDASGDRLRRWMGVTRDVFYNPKYIAIVPMGFCYPGKGKSGDLPPRPECAPAWRDQLLSHLNSLELTLVIGQYAQAYHMRGEGSSLTENVRAWEHYWPKIVPLPHPSPRNNIWFSRNPWFEQTLVPKLRQSIAELVT